MTVALILCVRLAAAETVGPDEAATEAGAMCEQGNVEGAAAAVRSVHAAFEDRLGPGHEATQVVRLYLARLERESGREDEAVRLETLPEADPEQAPLPPDLALALEHLHPCRSPHASAREKIGAISAEQQLNLARGLLNRGLYAKALEAAESARRVLRKDAEPREELDLYETLALIRLQNGDRSGALRDAAVAEERARKLGVLTSRINMARLTAAAGDFERAGAALDELEGEVAGDAAANAELPEARADLLLRLGSPRPAIELLDVAIERHRRVYGPADRGTASALHLQGDAYRMAGDFPAAKQKYDEALRIRTRTLGKDHPETASTRNAIGVLEADLGDWAAADQSFAAALASIEARSGADHPDAIAVRANRARAHWGAKRSRAAADEYAAAMEALAKALGEDHPSVAEVVRNMAQIEFDLGNYARSQELLDRALASQMRSLGPSHPALAQTRLTRGRLLAVRGDLAGAAAEVDEAVRALTASLGPEHPWVARARTARARIAIAQGDSARAFREATEASETMSRYMRRTFGAISDRQRALLAKDAQDVVGALVSVPDAPARKLYTELLPHRDSVLRSIAASRAAVSSDDPAGELLEKLATLRGRYVAAVMSEGEGSAARVKALARSIDGLEALAASAGAQVSDPDPDQVLAGACARLPSDGALIQFVAYDRTSRGSAANPTPAYGALVVSGGDCKVTRVDLGDASPIEEAAEEFAGSMRGQRLDARGARETLSRLLVAPLGPAVGTSHRWFVVPDSTLWGIPLGALPDPSSPEDYLIERVTIGYLTSTYELAQHAVTDPTKSSQALLIGAPDFGTTEKSGPTVLTSTGPCRISPFESLPGTERELEDIEEVMTVPPRVLVGAQATKANFDAELAHRPRLIHFATHAYFAGLDGCGADDDGAGLEGASAVAPNPLLLSGIVMAGANRPATVDGGGASGILTAYEVAGLDLRSAQLVVLSACDTGTGLQTRGQEVQGLRWGFRAAGASALVSSLWRSNDAATRRMMKSFYQTLYSKDIDEDVFRGAEALRRAQLEQLSGDKRLGLRRPLLWANFIFSGVL